MASNNDETWNVVIAHRDHEKDVLYLLPPTTTAEQVKERYANDINADARTLTFLTIGGDIVEDHFDLQCVGELVPGDKFVKLNVEQAAVVYIALYMTPDEPECIRVRLSQLPRDVHSTVCAALGLSQDRPFMLRHPMAPLNYCATLREQGIAEGAHLVADLCFNVEVRETWSGTVEGHLVYASEPCGLLAVDDATYPQRLVIGGLTVDMGSEVGEALMPHGSLVRSKFQLDLHILRDIVVLVRQGFVHRTLWPSDRIDKLLPKGSAMESLIFTGLPVDKTSAACRLDLPKHALLHADPLTISVRLSDGRRRKVRVPRLGTISDVRQEIRAIEGSDEFKLVRGGRVFDDDSAIAEALQGGDKPLQVDRHISTLTVTLKDRSVRWSTTQQSLTFTEVMYMVAQKSRVQFSDLISRTLECSGCGRRLSETQQDFQAIPAACCRTRSLTLHEPVMHDAATQSRTPMPQHTTTETQPKTRESEQMTAEMKELTSDKERMKDQIKELTSDKERMKDQIKEMAALITRLEAAAEEMSVVPALPQDAAGDITAVAVVVDSPTRDTFAERAAVPLDGAAATWRSLLAEAQRRLTSRIDGPAAVIQFGLLYRRRFAVRRAVSSTDASGRQDADRDEADGREVSEDDSRHHTVHVLLPDSAIRPCPGHLPKLKVLAPARVLEAAGDCARLKETSGLSLLEASSVALLTGLEAVDERWGAGPIFIRTADGGFVDIEAGRSFPDKEAAARAQTAASEHLRWAHLLIVLRDGARLPHWAIPRGETLHVHTRRGVRVAVQGRRLRRTGGRPELPAATWTVPQYVGDLQKQLTKAARR